MEETVIKTILNTISYHYHIYLITPFALGESVDQTKRKRTCLRFRCVLPFGSFFPKNERGSWLIHLSSFGLWRGSPQDLVSSLEPRGEGRAKQGMPTTNWMKRLYRHESTLHPHETWKRIHLLGLFGKIHFQGPCRMGPMPVFWGTEVYAPH